MRNLITSYLSEENGAAAAEYALILAIVGAAIGVAAYNLGTTISGAIQGAAGCIKSTGGSCSW